MIEGQILKVENLSKKYSSTEALKSVSFQISAGEKVALLGCNGAGKSTLLNIITALISPTSGTVKINNKDASHLEVKKRMAFLPQTLNFPDYLKVEDVLRLGRVHFNSSLNVELLKKLDLEKLLKRYCQFLSGGEKRKLGIVLSLMGERDLHILDEPTANIDLVARDEIHRTLDEVMKDRALLFSSHEMTEVEKLADRVIVLNKGHIVAHGTVQEIKSRFSAMCVIFESSDKALQLDRGLKIEKKENSFFVFGHSSDAIIREVVDRKIQFQNLRVKESTLEDVFLKLWKEEKG